VKRTCCGHRDAGNIQTEEKGIKEPDARKWRGKMTARPWGRAAGYAEELARREKQRGGTMRADLAVLVLLVKRAPRLPAGSGQPRWIDDVR